MILTHRQYGDVFVAAIMPRNEQNSVIVGNLYVAIYASPTTGRWCQDVISNFSVPEKVMKELKNDETSRV